MNLTISEAAQIPELHGGLVTQASFATLQVGYGWSACEDEIMTKEAQTHLPIDKLKS
jgi:hypothetical protein